MNDVEISVEGVDTPLWIGRARDFALAVLARLGKDGWDLSILLCDDPFMKGLNSQYRDRDEATDVLSFEQGERYRGPEGEERFLAGDIALSLDSIERNSKEFGVSFDEELRRLIIHGILHLSGMDHGEGKDDPMLAFQEEILRELAASSGAVVP